MFCGIQKHFPPPVRGCTPCLNPRCTMALGSDAPSSPFINTFRGKKKQATERRGKNTDFAAGKLLCLLLASINDKLHLSFTGYNALLVSRLEWCTVSMA